jgi:ADP-ribose pyrophosphatase YjhB (NUDIX family)
VKSYLQRLRALIGHAKIIHPAARILIENAAGEILFIERLDNGKLGIPAGAFEAGETIEDCIQREVREETGLEILSLELIGLSTLPERESVTYPNGDQVQYFTAEFYSNHWQGTPTPDQVETKVVRFLPPSFASQLPPNERNILESRAYYLKHGKPRLG